MFCAQTYTVIFVIHELAERKRTGRDKQRLSTVLLKSVLVVQTD